MLALFWISVGIGTIWAAMFISSLREFSATPVIGPKSPVSAVAGVGLPKISVLIPARNEADKIGACLTSLIKQEHEDLEIVVIDDHSTDETLEIVAELASRDSRIRVLQAGERPKGWMGKCHALVEGVDRGNPEGEWLLFIDADTLHHPASISAAMHAVMDSKADMLSLIPHLEAGGFWERLLQPTVAAIIALFNKPSRINSPDRPETFANGQYILIRKRAYLDLGGHRAVAGKVLEDVELARVAVMAGLSVQIARAPDLFTTRMYDSLHSLVQGWTKNLYMILRSRMSRVMLASGLGIVLSCWPLVFGILALEVIAFDGLYFSSLQAWVLIGIYLMVLAFQTILRGINRWYPSYAPLAPLANLIAAFILLRSAWLHLGNRGVVWKGRRVLDDERTTDDDSK